MEDKSFSTIENVPIHVHNGIDAPKVNFRDIETVRIGYVVFDPPSLLDGAGTTTTLTVDGCTLGDFVNVSFSLDLEGVIMTGYVSSNNTVSVRFQNETGGTKDLSSGTIKAVTFRT